MPQFLRLRLTPQNLEQLKHLEHLEQIETVSMRCRVTFQNWNNQDGGCLQLRREDLNKLLCWCNLPVKSKLKSKNHF